MKSTTGEFVSVSPGERIKSLDVLRGFAVLGILIMNIQSFSMISEAYINPSAYGDLTGINKWVWIFSHVLASDKFMAIFSMLFGAGIILFYDRAVAKGKKAGQLHYRRNFWLLVFGLLHAYLIWYGDILVAYALVGFFVFIFRKMKPRKLIIAASLFFIVPIGFNLMVSATMDTWPEEQYTESVENWKPGEKKIHAQLEAYRGGWLEQMPYRVEMALWMQTFLFFWLMFWRITALMLLGMALFKLGVFSAERSKGFYMRLTTVSLLLGYFLSSSGVYKNFEANWSLDFSMFQGSIFNYVGSVFVALGYVGVIMLICKSNGFVLLKRLLSAVGRMAFTNYIFMSLIGMFLFYGNGLGWFGYVPRWEQVLVVLGIWLVMLIGSPIWLKHYYYGPLEWLWRVLTYWKVQPFSRSNTKLENT